MKKKIALIAAILAFSSTLTGCFPLSSDKPNSGEETNKSSEADTKKTYSIDEFCTLFNEEERFASKHGDESFTITGTIAKNDDVFLDSIDFKSSVKSTEYDNEFRVTCKFEDKSVIEDLHKGDTITVTGTLFSFATNGIVLEDCKLDNVEKGDYKPTSVKIADHKLSKDYKGEDILVVNYEFYNGEEADQAFAYNFTDTAYQNGVECNDTVIGCDDVDAQTQLDNIQPGITYTVKVGYHIKDKSDVTIKITPWIGDEVVLEETLKLE